MLLHFLVFGLHGFKTQPIVFMSFDVVFYFYGAPVKFTNHVYYNTGKDMSIIRIYETVHKINLRDTRFQDTQNEIEEKKKKNPFHIRFDARLISAKMSTTLSRASSVSGEESKAALARVRRNASILDV